MLAPIGMKSSATARFDYDQILEENRQLKEERREYEIKLERQERVYAKLEASFEEALQDKIGQIAELKRQLQRMHSERCEDQQSNTAKMVNYQNQIQMLENIIVQERKGREPKQLHTKAAEGTAKGKKAPKVARARSSAEPKAVGDDISSFVEQNIKQLKLNQI